MEKISTLLGDQFAFSESVGKLINFALSLGYTCSLKECYRTPEQQEIYLMQGKTKTRSSQHQRGLAIDICFFQKGQWLTKFEDLKEIGKFWQNLGPDFRWGGDWNRSGKQADFFDAIHFELNTNWG